MIHDLIAQIRPRQWAKNVLLFAGVVFAHGANDPRFWLRAGLGFVAFSLASSSTYVLNDWLDREKDRQHPQKRFRPIAAGRIGTPTAVVLCLLLLVGAATVATRLGPTFAACAWSYVLLNLVYSAGLKRVMILDVLCIASGFVLRAIAGVEVLRPLDPAIELSAWLLVCTFFGALFLGSIKRRQELALVTEASRRHVLKHYSLQLLDDLILITAACTLFSYALYTIAPGTVQKFKTEALVYTIPFVVYGIFRYLYLTRTHSQGENPTEVLLGDRPILINGLLWILAVGMLVYAPWVRRH